MEICFIGFDGPAPSGTSRVDGRCHVVGQGRRPERFSRVIVIISGKTEIGFVS
jgi:hypothetical protein